MDKIPIEEIGSNVTQFSVVFSGSLVVDEARTTPKVLKMVTELAPMTVMTRMVINLGGFKADFARDVL